MKVGRLLTTFDQISRLLSQKSLAHPALNPVQNSNHNRSSTPNFLVALYSKHSRLSIGDNRQLIVLQTRVSTGRPVGYFAKQLESFADYCCLQTSLRRRACPWRQLPMILNSTYGFSRLKQTARSQLSKTRFFLRMLTARLTLTSQRLVHFQLNRLRLAGSRLVLQITTANVQIKGGRWILLKAPGVNVSPRCRSFTACAGKSMRRNSSPPMPANAPLPICSPGIPKLDHQERSKMVGMTKNC